MLKFDRVTKVYKVGAFGGGEFTAVRTPPLRCVLARWCP